MTSDTPGPPEPTTDEQPDFGPGGTDADESESDVGAASSGTPVTPDGPLSAQQDQVGVPDALQEPDEPAPDDEEEEQDETSEPSA